MKQNEVKNGQTTVENLVSSLNNKEVKKKKVIVKKQESLTAKEREELYSKKISAERREEMLSKMTDEEKEEFLKKEKQDRFFKQHKTCYLQLFSGHITKNKSSRAKLVIPTADVINNWGYMLRLFVKKEYIKNLEIKNIDTENTAIIYDFNTEEMRYESDCESMQTVLSQHSLMLEPMGNIIKEKKLEDIDNIDTASKKDDFNWEYEKEANEDKEEIISKEDSATKELNKNIAKELRKDNSVVVDLGAKLTGKSKEEIEKTLKAV